MKNAQLNQSKIASIHFGITSQSVMKHLVDIFKVVKMIRELKEKMANHPFNQAEYET
jgi:hypothetical protein